MSAPDLGYFGPGSVAWRIHSEPCTLVGGLRALLIQALNPVAMAAVAEHSDYKVDPWARFRRTSEFVTTTIFGSKEQVDRAARRVRAVHKRISGTDHVTGRTYRADDPDLLLWVHAVEVDSFLVAYRRYGRQLSDEDANRYVAEMVRAAGLVGLDPGEVPSDTDSLISYLGSQDLVMTPAAKDGMRVVLAPPMPLPLRPLWLVPATAAVAILPKEVRELYGLPWVSQADPAVRISTSTLFRTLGLLLPPPPPVRDAYARARALVG